MASRGKPATVSHLTLEINWGDGKPRNSIVLLRYLSYLRNWHTSNYPRFWKTNLIRDAEIRESDRFEHVIAGYTEVKKANESVLYHY